MALKILLTITIAAAGINLANAIIRLHVVVSARKELKKKIEEYYSNSLKDETMMTGNEAINLLVASMNESAMKGWRNE